MDTIKDRIQRLRDWMKWKGLNAYVIPSSDPHMSEYTAPHWESRQWISGFTGSAGTVVVTLQKAGLWTDSRYFLQAEEQLRGTGIDLYRLKLEGTPGIEEFLLANLAERDRVGIDGTVFAAADLFRLRGRLADGGLKVESTDDPMDAIWTDRPPMPDGKARTLGLEYAGRSCQEKIGDVRSRIKADGANGLWVPALDEIAWTLNLRGSDVHCNPVVVSYLYIGLDSTHLFIDSRKLDTETAAYLSSCDITVHPYAEAFRFVGSLSGQRIMMDPAQTNFATWMAAAAAGNEIVHSKSPIALLKAVRNATEIEGLHRAMVRDGVALVKFHRWLEQAIQKVTVTEIDIDRKLHELRAAQPLYRGESFDTIAAYGPHGAIVHYEATPETDVPLQRRGFVLIDSGAQYLDGTTDITRTVALGPLTDEERTDYTLILKGNIDLAMAVFPEGTRGSQVDILARLPIWKRRMNYLHGTGHGVGAFLNVHEGPQSIRMEENPVALRAGMTTSDEPGVYKAGSHGVRIENLLLVVPAGEGMFGRYLKFETVTLCPIDTTPIVKGLLTADEVEWLNQYHRTVCERLSPHLDADEQEWLSKATAPISL